MYINDPIGDLLTRIRNANLRGKTSVEAPASKMLVAIAEILRTEGFIADFSVEELQPQSKLLLTLKDDGIRGLRRVSKPGVRHYKGYRDMRPVRQGQGVAVITTPKGVITDKQARLERVGGEILFYVW